MWNAYFAWTVDRVCEEDIMALPCDSLWVKRKGLSPCTAGDGQDLSERGVCSLFIQLLHKFQISHWSLSLFIREVSSKTCSYGFAESPVLAIPNPNPDSKTSYTNQYRACCISVSPFSTPQFTFRGQIHEAWREGESNSSLRKLSVWRGYFNQIAPLPVHYAISDPVADERSRHWTPPQACLLIMPFYWV